jgi:hypothetical protein
MGPSFAGRTPKRPKGHTGAKGLSRSRRDPPIGLMAATTQTQAEAAKSAQHAD